MVSSLLDSKVPLDAWDREQLEQWLRILEEDCEVFGETPEDIQRMQRIRNLLLKDKLTRV